MQMTQRFCDSEQVEVLPMELYYGWKPDELTAVQHELALSETFKDRERIEGSTPYIEAVMWADLIIDFSGDIWGDNANFLGKDRFLIGLLKDQIAMNFGKHVVMLAGSPGPFSNMATRELAKQVYAGFELVTNREPISTAMLVEQGFNTSKTFSLACPAFLFEPAQGEAVEHLLRQEHLCREGRIKPLVGFILCGWNFETGPFDKWPRDDADYTKFAEAVEYLTTTLGVRVCLMSHSNGFDIPPAPFRLKHGRDYPIIKQLQDVLGSRGIAKDFFTLDGVYNPWQTKAIIGHFDMLVSGRVHAAVAGLSQFVPTVVMDYGHEPKAHKLIGFATVAGAENYVADPVSTQDLKKKIGKCWAERSAYRVSLEKHIPEVKITAKKNFGLLKELF
jgi:colanic acid/amylovoran biosynthesis protein